MLSLPEENRKNIRSQTTPFHILLVEDQKSNHLIVKYLFREFDLKLALDMVRNGREALDQIRQKPYDLILMDIFMPELDGLETVKQIRASDSFQKMPVIALTASTSAAFHSHFRGLGFNGYLKKPIERNELYAALEEHLACKMLPVTPPSGFCPDMKGIHDPYKQEKYVRLVNSIKEDVKVQSYLLMAAIQQGHYLNFQRTIHKLLPALSYLEADAYVLAIQSIEDIPVEADKRERLSQYLENYLKELIIKVEKMLYL